MADEKKIFILNQVEVEGAPKFLQILHIQFEHEVNELARAKVVLAVEEEVGKKFLNEIKMENTITIKSKEPGQNFFVGNIVNLILETKPEYNLLTMELINTAYLLTLKRATCSFQDSKKKHEDILKKVFTDSGTDGKVQFEKVTDKPVGKMILRLNETEWEFTKRMAGQLGAPICTAIYADKPLVVIGVPEPLHEVEITSNQIVHTFRDKDFEFFQSNKETVADSLNLIKEDFYSIHIDGCTENLVLGDKVKLNQKDYFVKTVVSRFVDNVLIGSYELVAKTSSLFSPILPQKNIAGRVFRAQVKKVEKDKVQAHLIDVDKEFDSGGDTWFPFSTAYSSTDGSGWYVMPEVDDYVRILFPSIDTADAFALSSVNTAPLKEPKNKSLKAPGGREILLTDDGIEIIGEHQKTFVKLDKSGGVNVVSAKDIVISADGNISFEAKGKVQMTAQKEITAQSGQSHVKILANQIDIGGNSIIIGE